MKPHFLNLLFLIGATGAITATAQAATPRIVANIPFAFHVGSKTFQPGQYVIDSPVRSEVRFVSSVTTGERIAALIGANETEQTGHARLVFRDYGDSKYLADIWSSDGRGTKLAVSKDERAKQKRWESNEVPMAPMGTE